MAVFGVFRGFGVKSASKKGSDKAFCRDLGLLGPQKPQKNTIFLDFLGISEKGSQKEALIKPFVGICP